MRLLAAAALLLIASCASASVAGSDGNAACGAPEASRHICRLDVSDIDETRARAMLGEAPLVVRRQGARFTIVARAAGEEARVCCSLQGPLTRIGGSDLWAARYRLARLDEAVLSLVPPISVGQTVRADDVVHWRGPRAPEAPAFNPDLRGTELERTLWSDAMGETRRLHIYLPPGHDASRTYPTLFMADGSSVPYFARIIEPLIDAGEVPPIVIVGAASGQRGIVEDRSHVHADLRNADYLPGFANGGDRFEQHLRFFSEELTAYAQSEFSSASEPHARAVAGFSSGGSFALFAGLRRPDIFAVSIALSASWRSLVEEDFSAAARARFFISGGLYEPHRARRAGEYARALRQRGYDVRFETPAMGHASEQSSLMLARYLREAFPVGR